MKAKLLKKLRRKYEIQERNGHYRVFDIDECAGGVYNKTEWTSITVARVIQRKWILKEAQRYRVAKKVIKP
jgi:hypothetical protein